MRVYYIHSLRCSSWHLFVEKPMVGTMYIYTCVGLSALLVSTYRAMRRPSERGTSDRTGSTVFVYVCKHDNTPLTNRRGGSHWQKWFIDEEFGYFEIHAHLSICRYEHGDECRNRGVPDWWRIPLQIRHRSKDCRTFRVFELSNRGCYSCKCHVWRCIFHCDKFGRLLLWWLLFSHVHHDSIFRDKFGI